MREMPDNSVDLVLGSPPYEAQRTYGIGFNLKRQDWVDWAVERYVECQRVSRGLVAWVVEGSTRQFRWSTTPALLMADLHRKGIKLRKPPVFHRVGIPGSGGPDWLRNDYEFIVSSSKGKLPWSDNTAMGHACKYGIGGAVSYRHPDGVRRNARTGVRLNTKKGRAFENGELPPGSKLHTKAGKDGMHVQAYTPPKKANPGNVIHCSVGGGRMGHNLAHETEAPFPESLAEFFIRSFCPPGGIVLDPFAGSGTTLCVAKKWGRNAMGIDIRQNQKDLFERRIVDPRYTAA